MLPIYVLSGVSMSEEEYYEEEGYEYAEYGETAEAVHGTTLISKRGGGVDKSMIISWAIGVASAGLVLALATVIVLFISEEEEEPISYALAPSMHDEQEEVEQKQKQKQLERSSSSAATSTPITVDLNVGEISVETVTFDVGADVGDVGNISGVGDVGNLSMGDLGGVGQMTSFMGIKTQGNKFAFIIDYSASMSKPQLDVMKNELIKTLSVFNRDVQVALVFFSGPAWDAITPKEIVNPAAEAKNWTNTGAHDFSPVQGYKPAIPQWANCTPTNRVKFEERIINTPTSFGTDWRHPFTLVYNMRPAPQVIYFMTDGSTRNPEETVEMVKRNKRIQVNPIAFGIPNQDAEAPMQEMAKLTRGAFKSYSKDEITKMAANLVAPANN
jgi:hypothetical protein